jgi:hypothetical protein
LYAAGAFATAGGVACNNIARWNGKAWNALGDGVNADAVFLNLDRNGQLMVGGSFTTAGGKTLPDHFAIWTGSMWIPLDVNLPGTAIIEAMEESPNGNLTIGYDTSGTAISSIVTVPNNASTKSYPKIRMWGPGTVWYIKNFTTGKAIYFTNLTLQDGEYALLDLTPGNISFVSSWRGNIMSYIAPGSNLAQFSLLPGANNIACYIYGSTGAATLVFMKWRNSFWSVDGGAN